MRRGRDSFASTSFIENTTGYVRSGCFDGRLLGSAMRLNGYEVTISVLVISQMTMICKLPKPILHSLRNQFCYLIKEVPKRRRWHRDGPIWDNLLQVQQQLCCTRPRLSCAGSADQRNPTPSLPIEFNPHGLAKKLLAAKSISRKSEVFMYQSQ